MIRPVLKSRSLHATRAVALGFAALLLGGLAASPALAQTPPGAAEGSVRAPWPKQVIEEFGSLPVQENGRVKPMSTFAAFELLKISGRRSYKTEQGEKLTVTDWILDCMFHREYAEQQKIFLIENDEALEAVGLGQVAVKRRDRYSYAELLPQRLKIDEKMREYAHVEASERSPVQEEIVRLGSSMRSFEAITHFLDFTRVQIPTGSSVTLKKLFPHRETVGGGALLSVVPQMIAAAERLRAEADEKELGALRDAIIPMERALMNATMIAFVPPTKSKASASEWLTPDGVAAGAFEEPSIMQRPLAAISAMQRMVDARKAGNEAGLLSASTALHKEVTSLAEARSEYGTVKLEVAYYKYDLLFWAKILFVLGFVIASASWLFPQSRKMPLFAAFPTGLGLLLLSGAIVMRCIIRSRPPVSTLYETIIFITAVCVLLALVTEWITRQRVALGLAALLGAMGMFLATKYEISGRQDTMPSLVAVLDTNFWLSTHVTTITIGYAAGLLASAVAHVYLLGKLFGIKRADAGFYRTVGRMVYGMICFSLLFSVVGTILGGVWANDSWGRFWGWDPKENGALMICLWQIAMLHGRMGGYLKAFGMSCAAIFGGMVVATSWWGVNLLQIGLHSYGFTSGAFVALMTFFGIEGVILLAMGVWWLVKRQQGTGGGPISGEPVPLG